MGEGGGGGGAEVVDLNPMARTVALHDVFRKQQKGVWGCKSLRAGRSHLNCGCLEPVT
jgi:hypothetical protein